MADQKLTDRSELSTLATGDKIHVVDVSDTTDDTTGSSKWFLISTISSYLASLAQTFTNKTIDGDTNTLQDIAVSSTKLAAGTGLTLSTDTLNADAASTTAVGVVELATIAETDTGTDTTRALTADGLQGTVRNIRYIQVRLLDKDTDVSVGTAVGGDFVIPFDGTLLQSDTLTNQLFAKTDTAGTTGTMIVDMNIAGTTVMTTNKLDIETTEEGTQTAVTQPDLTTTAVSAGDIVTWDIDAIHTTAAKGLVVGIAIRED